MWRFNSCESVVNYTRCAENNIVHIARDMWPTLYATPRPVIEMRYDECPMLKASAERTPAWHLGLNALYGTAMTMAPHNLTEWATVVHLRLVPLIQFTARVSHPSLRVSETNCTYNAVTDVKQFLTRRLRSRTISYVTSDVPQTFKVKSRRSKSQYENFVSPPNYWTRLFAQSSAKKEKEQRKKQQYTA